MKANTIALTMTKGLSYDQLLKQPKLVTVYLLADKWWYSDVYSNTL